MKQKKLVSTEPILRHSDHDLTKKWYLEWYDSKGKRCKKYDPINRFDTIEDREKAARELLNKLLYGIEKPKPSTSILYQHLEKPVALHLLSLRPASKKDYLTVLNVFERWLLKMGYKNTPPANFLKIDAEKFCRFLEIEQKRENATYNKYVNVLDMFLGYLIEADVIQKSPFAYIKRKTKHSISVSAFKEDAVAELKDVLIKQNMTVYISCMVCMYAFIRPGEITKLKVGDIDLEANKIYVDKTISKNKKSQYVSIVAPLQEILAEYIGVLKEKAYYLLSKSGRPGIIPISSKYVVENHNRILGKLGYDTDKFKPYSWKHTGNSLAYKNGASIRFLKLQNRHHSESMTEIYIKSIVPEDLVKGEEQYFNF